MNRHLSNLFLVFAAAGCSQGSERQDSARSVAAFEAVYPVFMHPRCMNCHPAGDVPLVGEDSHPHLQNVKRGIDGRGLFALRCTNCHQEKNLAGEHLPPGHPDWRLPPKATPMVFQGRTPGELARQLKDPHLNGGKSLEQLLAHVEEDPLVVTSWTRGDGRSVPPLNHETFARRFRDWIETGAEVPK
ncbi:MAG TPA: hypothetical protein VMU54_26180 [Planctomycetota bacterium]|nr:hypothetical protein [Planctomycetota bacterium]